MNTTQAQQKALDDAFVSLADRLEFRKCNMRLKTDIKPKEAIFQVVLDSLALTPFYQAFLITAEVPAIYMKEFWATDKSLKTSHCNKISSLSSEILDTLETSSTSLIHEDTQVYGTILLKELINQAMLESKAYKTYYDFASREKTLKPKLKTSAKVVKSDKKKQPAKIPKAKGLDVLSKVALTKAEQLKLATKRSKIQFHSSHACSSGDGVDTQSKVPNEQQQKVTDDKDAEEESDKNDDSEETKSDNDEDDLTHPNLSTYKADEEEEEEEEKADDEEVYSDQRVSTPPDYELTEEEEENKEDDDKDKEGEQEVVEDDLYRDLNINLERSDAEMTDAQENQDTEDTHVTLTYVPLVVQQQSSSVSSDLVSKFINPSPDIGINSILNQDTQSDTLVNVLVSIAAKTPSSVTTIPQPPIPNIQPLQQTLTSTTTTTNPIMTLPKILNFTSLFQFDQRVSALESEMSDFRQTSQFTKAISSIPSI
ncbi:hypothetical protein Tco_1413088 [Tanacetum coccineum]